MTDATERFSGRVESYIQSRPGYPLSIIEVLVAECGLIPALVVADIGSGTGILSELFLKYGNQVVGVEPNREMREAGAALLRGYPHFRSVEGSAEATGLDAASVDLVVAGQAFHWFNQDAARSEFARILRPNGSVALIWNARRLAASPFLAAYEALLQTYGTDYREVNHRGVGTAALDRFFGPGHWQQRTFENIQRLDFAGLKGRLLSSSYVPAAGQPGYEPMLAALEALFARHQRAGLVDVEYDTLIFYGQLSSNYRT